MTCRRIGLVGWHCPTGLGELNRQIATYGDVTTWMIKYHPALGMSQLPDHLETICCPVGSPLKVDRFLASVDVIVFCEFPVYGAGFITKAKQKGKRVVVIPMQEWMPPGGKGWPEECDLFLCPTKHCYDQFCEVLPCVHFPWPVDTNRFQFKLRQKCERFLFVNGHGGWHGRKGEAVVREAKRLWSQMPLTVASQKSDGWPADIPLVGNLADNSCLYVGYGDVLLAPHSCDGLGLEPIEAMASGMPVVTTEGLPWNENPALVRIPAVRSKRFVRRPTNWYLPDPVQLATICQEILGKDISKASLEARAWAESRSWASKAAEFNRLVRGEQ